MADDSISKRLIEIGSEKQTSQRLTVAGAVLAGAGLLAVAIGAPVFFGGTVGTLLFAVAGAAIAYYGYNKTNALTQEGVELSRSLSGSVGSVVPERTVSPDIEIPSMPVTARMSDPNSRSR